MPSRILNAATLRLSPRLFVVLTVVFLTSSERLCAEASLEERIKALETMVQKQQQTIDRQQKEIQELRDRLAGTGQPSEKAQTGAVQGTEKAAPAEKDDRMDVRWNKGVEMASRDGNAKFRMGGRIQNDWAILSPDDALKAQYGAFEDGTEFRRVRINVSGLLYNQFTFKAEYDFAGGEAELKDAYIGVTKLPYLGTVQFGHQKEPLGMEELTSTNVITFLEKGSVTAFTPDRNTGVRVNNCLLDERVTWWLGAFHDADGFGEGVDEEAYSVTARVSGLPLYLKDGQRLLHLGAAYSHQEPQDDQVRFSERPEAHLAPTLVDTGNIETDSVELAAAEFAAVYGPASLQAEYQAAFVKSLAAQDPEFDGVYVAASYFITGEVRPYDRRSGFFSAVTPKRNFLGKEGGLGAWEAAARYSSLNLNDEAISGGKMNDVTLGLNWYWNPNMRLMLDYVFADPDGPGDADIFKFRINVFF